MHEYKEATKREFVEIVKRYYDGRYELGDVSDRDEMMSFSILHQLNSLYCYMILSDKSASGYDKSDIYQRYLSNIKVNIAKGRESETLAKYLREKGVPFSYIKGQYIKRYYTPSEVRSMGDADIYIPRASMDIAKEYFDANGFEISEYYDGVTTYKKDIFEFEVHNVIDWFGVDWSTRAELQADGYSLRDELKFTLIHALKHIAVYGCGMRQVLDIALLLREDSSLISDEGYMAELRELHLLKAHDTLIGLVNKWFGTNYPRIYDDGIAVGVLESAVLDGGVFGGNVNDYVTVNTVKTKSKTKMYLRMLFPKYERMVLSYPILKDKKYLLWHYYMKRLYERGIKQKRYKLISKSKDKSEARKSREQFVLALELDEQYYNKI